MRTWIVSYGDAAFATSRQRLMDSAARYGIDERRAWDREALERTILYQTHRATLDELRGGGYWLWKPFIIMETLKELAFGDLLVYADAGIEIIGEPAPLFQLCAEERDIVLFAGHYDDAGAPGPNVCAKWTKRDAFVCMDCDTPRYHQARMIDASFLIIKKTTRSIALVREWLLCCCQPHMLTDAPNICGLANLPEFVGHRHDQSLLSILAEREGIELFRHPSQHGNHAKAEPYREPGEWTRAPYGAHGVYGNSPYPTLLGHHRGHLGQTDLRVVVRRCVPAPSHRVFQAWSDPDVIVGWPLLGGSVLALAADFRAGGRYRMSVAGHASVRMPRVMGTFLAVEPPARLAYSWPWQTKVSVEFQQMPEGTSVTLIHGSFPTEKLREYHARAWKEFLDRIAASVQHKEAD
jgi:uncharacterized protein YndB with AHSA1/START domain